MEFEEFGMPLDEGGMRLESEIIKLRLNAEYGAIFPDAAEGAPDPELEYNFLKRVLQLHQRIANTPPRPLREILDFEQFAPIDALEDSLDLETELEDALDYLEDSNVLVEFQFDYSDRVMYEFILNELPALEVIGKPADDEYICVLYEAFHPNPEAEIDVFSNDFFSAVISRHLRDEFPLYFSTRPQFRLRGYSREEILQLTDRFLDYFPRILHWEAIVEERSGAASGEFSEGSGDARGTVRFQIQQHDGREEVISGPFRLQLFRSNGIWRILDFSFFGFSWETAPGSDS